MCMQCQPTVVDSRANLHIWIDLNIWMVCKILSKAWCGFRAVPGSRSWRASPLKLWDDQPGKSLPYLVFLSVPLGLPGSALPRLPGHQCTSSASQVSHLLACVMQITLDRDSRPSAD